MTALFRVGSLFDHIQQLKQHPGNREVQYGGHDQGEKSVKSAAPDDVTGFGQVLDSHITDD